MPRGSRDHLCPACAEHFAAVRAHLDAMGVAYRLEPGLVRGLDYYTRTAFEFYRRGAEGQQQALGGGGRYDGLIELLGGKPTPGIGFALGLDRVVLALGIRRGGRPADAVPVAVVVGADPADTLGRLRIATELRAAGLPVRAELSVRKLGRQLEAAVREGAQFAVILGDELAEGEVQLRDLDGGSQKPVPLADLPALLRRKVRSVTRPVRVAAGSVGRSEPPARPVRTGRIAVGIESTPKKVFASALDWPGWTRAGRDEATALAALDACRRSVRARRPRGRPRVRAGRAGRPRGRGAPAGHGDDRLRGPGRRVRGRHPPDRCRGRRTPRRAGASRLGHPRDGGRERASRAAEGAPRRRAGPRRDRRARDRRRGCVRAADRPAAPRTGSRATSPPWRLSGRTIADVLARPHGRRTNPGRALAGPVRRAPDRLARAGPRLGDRGPGRAGLIGRHGSCPLGPAISARRRFAAPVVDGTRTIGGSGPRRLDPRSRDGGRHDRPEPIPGQRDPGAVADRGVHLRALGPLRPRVPRPQLRSDREQLRHRVRPGRGRADPLGLRRLHARRRRPALPRLRADRVERACAASSLATDPISARPATQPASRRAGRRASGPPGRRAAERGAAAPVRRAALPRYDCGMTNLATPYRTHTCGALRGDDAGAEVRLAGWVHRRRDHGHLIFLDLRDRHGITQVVIDADEAPDAHAAASALPQRVRRHASTGSVARRLPGMENAKLPTGAIELRARELTVLAEAKTPPVLHQRSGRHRRRIGAPPVSLPRHPPGADAPAAPPPQPAGRGDPAGPPCNGFVEIETPILIKSTPEGARDFIVPSRLQPGTVYALPQSPQQLKQLLMVAGHGPLLPDRALLPRRGPPGRPSARVHPARPGDELRDRGDGHGLRRGDGDRRLAGRDARASAPAGAVPALHVRRGAGAIRLRQARPPLRDGAGGPRAGARRRGRRPGIGVPRLRRHARRRRASQGHRGPRHGRREPTPDRRADRDGEALRCTRARPPRRDRRRASTGRP